MSLEQYSDSNGNLLCYQKRVVLEVPCGDVEKNTFLYYYVSKSIVNCNNIIALLRAIKMLRITPKGKTEKISGIFFLSL